MQNPESQITASVFRRVTSDTTCRAAAFGGTGPTSSSMYSHGSGLWAGGIGSRTAGIGVLGIPVFAPFPDIAMHVIQAKTIGLKLSNRGGVGIAIIAFDPK